LNDSVEDLEYISSSLKDDLSQISTSNLTLISDVNQTLSEKIDEIDLAINVINSQLDEIDSDISELEGRTGNIVENSPRDVYQLTYKSIVVIRTPSGQGSGFLFNDENQILTNWHVVQSETEIEVEFYDRTKVMASVVGTDAYSDVAVIQVEIVPSDSEPLDLSNSSDLYIGQQVIAIGNPLGLTSSLSSGFISQINRIIEVQGAPLIIPVIQLDVTIAPGSSGGPLLNMDGQIVGITNAGTGEGFNFAVPSNIVNRVTNSLLETGSFSHAYFGFVPIFLTPESISELNILNVDPFQTGLLIVNVVPDFPAQIAGLSPAKETTDQDGNPALMANDIIIEIDSRPLATQEDWRIYVSEKVSPGDTVIFKLWRSGEIVEIPIIPVERPLFNG